ncbi:RNA-dependent RNA polymerase [Thalictrum thalictroides]|uniref:RNA-dependent RNA polymerase n=1 Tax=Thalictrum thalictroides TaxID=46969 RepID=A0A7J6X2C5_THATH|nr:RNA-dependent RNA polymerase [Thalictrum thalictroides]
MEEERNCTPLSPSSSSRNSGSASLKKQDMSNSSLLAFLGELEFRKAFLILSYSGKNKLENFLSVDSIRKMKDWPMIRFESEVWKVMGCKCIKEVERKKNLDWDSGKTYLYHCHVDPDLTYTFKGPYLQKQRTHLQKVVGDANVLDVRFSDGVVGGNNLSSTNISNSIYHKVAKEGILVGLLRYQFFVFKDGGKAEKKKNPTSSQVKCYFVCLEADPFVDRKWLHTPFSMSIREARCVFMHVHGLPSVAKYMARLSLILSKTVTLEVDLAMVNVENIDDIYCLSPDGHKIYNEDGEPFIHTDGTGFISEDLALKCPQNMYKVKDAIQGELERVLNQSKHERESSVLAFSKSHSREPPLLIQARFFYNGTAVKGTFLVNKKLPPNTIQVRSSMIKVETDPTRLNAQSANSFEIVKTSYRPKRTSNLSRYLISLLSYGGVPTEFFMELLVNSLEDARNAHTNKRAALKISVNHGELDDFLLTRMILCGIPLDEPYLKSRLSVVMKEENKGLKNGKIPISESYFLMGTADPTGMLKDDQVCVILDHGQVSGEVLVYRHPGLHFGDVHVLTATCIKEMDEFVGNSKYAIFFPTKGPRSLADEIANGDFDGDLYWVSRNPELLASYNASEPWVRKYSTKKASQTKPIDFSNEELEDFLFQQFLRSRFHPSYNVGSAADSWLAFMDRLLILGDDCAEEKSCLREKMLHLIDVYYDALDAPKTGKKVEVPTELKAEKFPHYMERHNSFCSKSVLGLIYDTANSFQTTELPSQDTWKLPCFEEKAPSICMDRWEEYFNCYRSEMTSALKIDDKDAKEVAADTVYQKYKQILYDAEEFENSTRKKEDIFNDALAIYHISYDYGKPNFAWKVAGRALCSLYASKHDNDLIVCQKSVLREILN